MFMPIMHAMATVGDTVFPANSTSESNMCIADVTGQLNSGAVANTRAVWVPTDDYDDGNNGYTPLSCSYDGALTTPTTAPTRRGYTFIGWTFNTQP